MKKILLLGSGELGKEFVIAAMRAGQYVIACDRYDNAPAMQVADEREVFSMLDGDALEAVVNKHKPDIIVPEIEAIRTERLFKFEEQGIQVVPSARAVNFTMNRRAIRDLAAKELGLRTAKYFYAKTFEEFKAAADEIGFPCVVKPLMSSSGHGQSYVHNDGELEQAFKEAMNRVPALLCKVQFRADPDVLLIQQAQQRFARFIIPAAKPFFRIGCMDQLTDRVLTAEQEIARIKRRCSGDLAGFPVNENGIDPVGMIRRPERKGVVFLLPEDKLFRFLIRITIHFR